MKIYAVAVSIPLGLATLVLIPLGYYTYESYRSHLRLINAPRVEAFLEDEYTKITNKGNVKYDVSYQFKVGENSYSGKSTVSNKPTSRRVFVLYDPEDPTISVLEGGRDSFDGWTDFWNRLIAILVVGFILSIVSAVFKSRGQKSLKQTTLSFGTTASEHIAKLKLSAENIIWLESELLNLNREIHGEDRPKESLVFLQLFPKALLENESISTGDIAMAAETLVKQTSRWLRLDQSRKWDVPFSKPRVEFTTLLPEGEPGHIEFGTENTTIRIHPKFSDDPFALAAILCHELAHFILDHNGMRRGDKNENEKLTDFFVFKCGQGLIYLQGVVNVDEFDGRSRESRLGYLSLEEMAYAHIRCASQYGLSKELIAPKHFRGKAFVELDKAINFLSLRGGSGGLAEVVLCKNAHILRISAKHTGKTIRCPKCKWETIFWRYRDDHINSLMISATKLYNDRDFLIALPIFREAQIINKKYSPAYCFASRCLKKLNRHQDAIRELRKLLDFYPEDEMAQKEMKNLIYETRD